MFTTGELLAVDSEGHMFTTGELLAVDSEDPGSSEPNMTRPLSLKPIRNLVLPEAALDSRGFL